MSDETEKKLAFAFAAESKASARNATFAKKADMEGYQQIARLFRAVSESEFVHARRYLLFVRGKIGSLIRPLQAIGKHKQHAAQPGRHFLKLDSQDERFFAIEYNGMTPGNAP